MAHVIRWVIAETSPDAGSFGEEGRKLLRARLFAQAM
jgi:hypothetical protein